MKWATHSSITDLLAKLSDREREAFLLFCQGYTPTQVGGALNMSVKTASTYRARIREKVGMFESRDFVALALNAAAADTPLLDAISVPGATTKVFIEATENLPDPPTRNRARVMIPAPNGFVESHRATLREAIVASMKPETPYKRSTTR